jgi:hypothetical protein
MTKTQQNLTTVLTRIIERVRNDPDEAEVYSEAVEGILDSYRDNDFFGTEGQLDPRGDMREGDWSLFGEIQQGEIT